MVRRNRDSGSSGMSRGQFVRTAGLGAAAGLGGVASVTSSMDPEEMTRQLILRHLNAFLSADLDLLMEDYAHDSVMFTPSGAVLVGPEQIRTEFEFLVSFINALDLTLVLDVLNFNGWHCYVVWHAVDPNDNIVIPFGTDTLYCVGGKIRVQSYGAYITLPEMTGSVSYENLASLLR